MKNPTLAAVINFVLPGAAYIWLKERVVFGWLILSSTLITWFAPMPGAVDTAFDDAFENFIFSDWALVGLAGLLYLSAFAVDAYRIAKAQAAQG